MLAVCTKRGTCCAWSHTDKIGSFGRLLLPAMHCFYCMLRDGDWGILSEVRQLCPQRLPMFASIRSTVRKCPNTPPQVRSPFSWPAFQWTLGKMSSTKCAWRSEPATCGSSPVRHQPANPIVSKHHDAR